MKSVSIKSALIGSLALLTIAIGAANYMAFSKLGDINQNVVDYATDVVPAMRLLGAMNADLADFRRIEAEYILAKQPDMLAKRESRLANLRESVSKDMTSFEKLNKSANVLKPYKSFKTALQDYMQLHPQALKLAQDSKRDEALALFDGKMADVFQQADGFIDNAVEKQQSVADEHRAASAEEYEAALVILLTGLGLDVVISLGVMGYAVLGVSKPLTRLTAAMKRLAEGEFDLQLPGLGRGDEIGSIASAVERFKIKAAERAQAEAKAELERNAAAVAERRAAMIGLADAFEEAVGSIVRVVSEASFELQSAAQSLSATSRQTTDQSSIVAAASEEAATNVRTVAAAAEELAGSVQEISRQVHHSAQIADKAESEAERSNLQVVSLSESAEKIGHVIELINDIAGKTNLLALNATIEAARAGEAGKGFAVVAQEVKALAEQTAKATAQIAPQIKLVQTSTQEAADTILGIGRTIKEINNVTTSIASAVEEQGSVSKDIARNVHEAAQGTTEVTENISGVNQAAQTSSVAAEQVLSSAAELSRQAGSLRSEMDKFLTTVRAA